MAKTVKNLLANTGDTRDMGSTPGSGRSPGEGMANQSSILAWEIPWTPAVEVDTNGGDVPLLRPSLKR